MKVEIDAAGRFGLFDGYYLKVLRVHWLFFVFAPGLLDSGIPGFLEEQGFPRCFLAIPISWNSQKKGVIWLLRLGLGAHHQLQFVQLGGVEDARSIKHNVASRVVLGEGDAVANTVKTSEEADETVKTVG